MKVISSVNGMFQAEDDWNNLVGNCSENPFFLSSYLIEFARQNLKQGWVPLTLVFSTDGAIVGLAPLVIRRRYGIRFVRFSLPPSFFSDFVLESRYRDICIEKTYNVLFNKLNCQLVNLALPIESPNLDAIKNNNHLRCSFIPQKGHRFLIVDRSWNEFEKMRGKKFNQDIRRTERKLDSIGSWRVSRYDERNQWSETIGRILEVERSSWKEGWRLERGMKVDEYLMTLWNGAVRAAKAEHGFKWSIWILELNALPIAYVFAIQYKGVAYFAKTSHNRRYRSLSPGVYILNAAMRDVFGAGDITKVDFHTDLPFIETWTSNRLPRVRILIAEHKMVPALLKLALSNKILKAILLKFVHDLA